MKVEDILMLKCVDCDGDITFVKGKLESDIIEHGILECKNCNRKYPIIKGVGLLFKLDTMKHYLSEWEIKYINDNGYNESLEGIKKTYDNNYLRQVKVAKNWEYQWNEQYNYIKDDFYTNYFLSKDFFYKCILIDKQEIENKIIYIACAGKGREAVNINLNKPQKIICGEIGNEIYEINKMANSEKLILLKSDVMDTPIKNGVCDISICDHALQHVLDHKKAFFELTRVLKRKGLLAICVYSYENNFIMTKLIEPAKIIFNKIPIKMLLYLSFVPAIIVQSIILFIYKPFNSKLKKYAAHLPLNEHMMFWSKFNFKTIWTSCFDLMHAPISYHFKEKEIRYLADNNNLRLIKIINTHGTTWSMLGEKI